MFPSSTGWSSIDFLGDTVSYVHARSRFLYHLLRRRRCLTYLSGEYAVVRAIGPAGVADRDTPKPYDYDHALAWLGAVGTWRSAPEINGWLVLRIR